MCSHKGSKVQVQKSHRHRRSRNLLRSARKRTMSLFIDFVIFLRVYIDWFIDYIFSFFYVSERQILPQPTNPLILESATSLASKIRNQKIKSEEVVRAFIERIKEVDPILNAVVDSRFDDALKEARKIDERIANNEIDNKEFNQKPFLGVPFTTKESTHCSGMKNSFGILCRKDIVAQEDANVVKALKEAGGILLGVTNIPQLNMWVETANPIYGTTCNPYDTTRDVGGSSGGEAAIIAAGGSPFGIGTDIGGSIRMPCFKCGLFGHKPTHELISTKGLTYRTGSEGSTMVAVGPMTKTVDDIIPFLKVLLGEKASILKLDEKVDVKDIEVFYIKEIKDVKLAPLTTEMQHVLSKAINHFEGISKMKPQKLEISNIKYGGKIWRYWITQEGNSNFNKDLTNRESEINSYTEILKFIARRSEFNIGTISVLFNRILPAEKERWARNVTEDLTKELTAILGNNGVLLYPSAPYSARFHNTAVLRPWNFYYFAIWNALKFPVTQVPMGLDAEGLPVGIQVVAAPNQDRLCIAVAKELEKAFGGYVPPFTLDKGASD